MNLNNNLYDKLKFLVQVLIPGFATLYLALDQIWDLPEEQKVAATCVAAAAFLGLFLTASARQYDGAGDLLVTEDATDGQVYLSTDLNKHPAAFKNKKNIVLNVKHSVVDPDAA